MGEMDEWQRWKFRTEFAFDGSGYYQVLIDAIYSNQNTQTNQVVYSQLALATFGGTSHHLTKQ